MPAEALATPASATAPLPRRALFSEAASLLLRAAAPERRHLWHGTAWLLLAATLEALGPLAGKVLIDTYLLPRNSAEPGRPASSHDCDACRRLLRARI